MSQKHFVEIFLSAEDGSALISIPKLSNLENKGGNNLDAVCRLVAERLDMDFSDFSLDTADFSNVLEDSLSRTDVINDSNLDSVLQEADSQSELAAFIRTLSNHLTDLLLSDQLRPGDRIPSERALSKQFGVSRSVSREALKVLNVLGMIDIIPGRGTFIASGSSDFFITPISWAIYLTEKNTDDVFFVRRSLEESTIQVACSNATPEDIEGLKSILRKTRIALENEDYGSFSELDIEFHMSLVTCSQNDVAVSLLTVLRKLSRSISQKGMENKRQLEDICREHESILNAIESKDKDMARKMLIRHFENTNDRYYSNTSNR